MKRIFLIGMSLLIGCCCAVAQPQTFTITDKQPALVDGLELGYTIKSTEVKNVSGTGDQSRYSVNFYVRNTTNQGKIMLYKQGWNLLGGQSDQLAQFDCRNATGARFTSKEALINAAPCNVLALVDNNCDPRKKMQEKHFVQIGYWVPPGQTISTNAILITPLNTLPDMQVTYLAGQSMQLAAAYVGGPVVTDPAQAMLPVQQVPPPIADNGVRYVHLRNNFNNTYLNNQAGPPQSTKIDNGWFSAQWQVIQLPGTRMVNIRNRWNGSYLITDPRGYVTFADDFNIRASEWSMEPTNDQNVYRFRNAQSGGYLCIAGNGYLIQSVKPDNDFCSGWLMEQL